MSQKSFADFVASPLLTRNELKNLRFGKSHLGYTAKKENEDSTPNLLNDHLESCFTSSDFSDEEEYVF